MNIILIIAYVAGILFAFHQGSIFGERRGFRKAMDPYCDECGSCGEAGCCPPVQCKYFWKYMKEHKREEQYEKEEV